MCADEQTLYDALRDRLPPQLRGLIMTTLNVLAANELGRGGAVPEPYASDKDTDTRASASAVSWGAIFAGAVVSAALSHQEHQQGREGRGSRR